MDWKNFSLEEQVAQLMMVGYTGEGPGVITERFLSLGVGGLIFFRDNFQPLPNASAVRNKLQSLTNTVPNHLPKPLMGIDQEGGQVERLPHTLFPTGLTPRAIANSKKPFNLARIHYREQARNLRRLGFTLNFFPTLDVNFHHQNPIIGVRSFGDDPSTVWQFSQIALQEFEQAGLIAVGKHFPGHGNGTVDSHYDLPTLHFTEEELWPFRQSIDAGIPVMLVAHGYYPALQTTPEERSLPSSASPAVIQQLLRKRCGFDGVIITDDMCMGAITKHRSPVEAALASIKAGVDILLYKQSTQDEWDVFEALVQAFKNGTFPMSRLHESLSRIAELKNWLAKQPEPYFSTADFTEDACAAHALKTAFAGINPLQGDTAILPIDPKQPFLLVHPDRREMGNYAFDIPTSPEFSDVLKKAGFSNLQEIRYPLKTKSSVETLLKSIEKFSPATIEMVSFNPLLSPIQVQLYQTLQQRFPNSKFILVSAGTPYDSDILTPPNLHLSLSSYRPATMQALTNLLLGKPS
jgi:beta-N-acetylhexosaminidase